MHNLLPKTNTLCNFQNTKCKNGGELPKISFHRRFRNFKIFILLKNPCTRLPASTWVSTPFQYDIWRLRPQISYNLLHHFGVKLHQFAINYDTSVFLSKVCKPLKTLDFSAFQEVRKSSKHKLYKFLLVCFHPMKSSFIYGLFSHYFSYYIQNILP